VVPNWLAIPILLSFERVVAKSSADNLSQVLMQVLMHQKGLTKKMICTRFMTFGVNGVFTFQGTGLGVTWQISNVWAPHSIGVHYMAHKTNLVV
jgi:hypothetical protein